MDRYAEEVLGVTRRVTSYGEVFALNIEAAVWLLLKATDLHDLATCNSMKMAWMANGAKFTTSQTHVVVGVKIMDHHGRHPVTEKPLVSHEEMTIGNGTYVNLQSRELCCILVMVDARDSKSLYKDVFYEYY